MDTSSSRNAQLSRQVQELTKTVAKLSASLEQSRAGPSAPPPYEDIDYDDQNLGVGVATKTDNLEVQPPTTVSVRCINILHCEYPEGMCSYQERKYNFTFNPSKCTYSGIYS